MKIKALKYLLISDVPKLSFLNFNLYIFELTVDSDEVNNDNTSENQNMDNILVEKKGMTVCFINLFWIVSYNYRWYPKRPLASADC